MPWILWQVCQWVLLGRFLGVYIKKNLQNFGKPEGSEFSSIEKYYYLVGSSHLKRIGQNGNLPQTWMQIRQTSNHHSEISPLSYMFQTIGLCMNTISKPSSGVGVYIIRYFSVHSLVPWPMPRNTAPRRPKSSASSSSSSCDTHLDERGGRVEWDLTCECLLLLRLFHPKVQAN